MRHNNVCGTHQPSTFFINTPGKRERIAVDDEVDDRLTALLSSTFGRVANDPQDANDPGNWRLSTLRVPTAAE